MTSKSLSGAEHFKRPGKIQHFGLWIYVNSNIQGRSLTVCWVIHAIIDHDFAKCIRVDAFKASHIVAIFTGVRTTLMMCVDATVAAKIVLGGMSIEFVKG